MWRWPDGDSLGKTVFKGIGKVVSFFGIVAGSLSLVLLIQQGFALGFAAPLQLMLHYYHSLIQTLFGWADAPLQDVLRYLARWIPLDLHLYPHWKHVFVLMWLYFGATARAAWRVGARGTGIFYVIWGGLVALVASVFAGTIELGAGESAIRPNLLLTAIPAIGIVVFELGRSAWAATWHRETHAWLPAFLEHGAGFNLQVILGSAIILLTYVAVGNLAVVRAIPSPGLTLLGCLVLMLASYYIIIEGMRDTDHNSSKSAVRRFRHLGSRHVGVLIFTAILGAMAFLVLNAGLTLARL